MSLSHLFRYGRSLSPATAAGKAGRYLGRRFDAWLRDRRNAGRSTYPTTAEIPGLAPTPAGLADAAPRLAEADLDRLERLADNHAAHRFDLLGSGWVEVRHGMTAAGFEGHRHPPHDPAADLTAIVARLSPGNRAPAAEIRAALSESYVPIDWQIDFRSGYRWREDRGSAGIPFGHEAGIDVKLPWELARLQHLPGLALAARLGAPDKRTARRHECRDQIIDFISANPPGYGVNWHCTMDVAIRAANMAMAHWLLGAEAGDAGFERELARSLLAHGRHIMANLEHRAGFNGNHYLADVCGLAFVAAALEPTNEVRHWWNFAKTEVVAETAAQFGHDGANREGSTSYHRLSAEMVAWTVALVLGRDRADTLPADTGIRLARMAAFSADATKSDGCVVQVGDNDSGRFFSLGAGDVDDRLDANPLDHGALIAAIGALTGTDTDAGERFTIERALAGALSGGNALISPAAVAPDRISPLPAPAPGSPHGPEAALELPDGVLDGVVAAAYPDFGLYIWKSPRLFVSVRCGPVGQNGHGGHAHNDQLAIELQVDGVDWLADPGSYVYTADSALRDAYRSVIAHAAPRMGTREPASLALGMFRLEDSARAECLRFDAQGFLGRHFGFGEMVCRAVRIEPGRIRLRDAVGGGVDWAREQETVKLTSAEAARRHFGIRVPFSPGYGRRRQD
ncbi:MAG: heparinase II/III family protein [Rhodospirillaceae bacterium]